MVSPQHMHWIGSVPLGATIAVLGILGNFLSIVVWNRLIKGKLKDNRSTGVHLIALAICDTVSSVNFELKFILLTQILQISYLPSANYKMKFEVGIGHTTSGILLRRSPN